MKEQLLCNNTVNEIIQNNLLPTSTKIQYPCGRVETIELEIYYRVKEQSMHNNVSEIDNLLAEGTKFSIHVEELKYYRVKEQ